jgi:transposase-like protein
MNNPQVRQVMQMMNGKTPEQLRQMANNMAAERGTTVEDIARQLGIQIPSNR